MGRYACTFLLGVFCASYLPGVPSLSLCLYGAIAGGVVLSLLPGQWRRLTAVAFAGAGWMVLRVALAADPRLPVALEGEELLVRGVVASVPDIGERQVRFDFRIREASHRGVAVRLPELIRLSWYGGGPMAAGSQWTLPVRLKRPHGLSNPGGFDYERWLFERRIGATGYVRDQGTAKLESIAPEDLASHIVQWRQRIAGFLAGKLPASPFLGLAQVLSVGVRDRISPAQWQTLADSGTTHLMAISGLHIGLVGGLAFWLALHCWSLLGASRHLPAPLVAAFLSLFAVACYTALAGFEVPARRSLVMFSVIALALLVRRRMTFTQGLGLALVAVLLLDPLAATSVSFWLSFGAVAAIGWGLTGRPAATWWNGMWRTQVVVSIALIPFTVVYFGLVPPLSIPANLLAVPVTTLVVVPLILLSLPLALVSDPLAANALALAIGAMQVLWHWLEWCAAAGRGLHAAHWAPAWTLIPGVVGAAILLLPRGFPARWIGALWLLPMALPGQTKLADGEFDVTILDVGQGLATVVRTARHILVYDTGARFSDRFDIGSDVVVPYLRTLGALQLDLLVVSHADADHSGGAPGLLHEYADTPVVSGQPEPLAEMLSRPVQGCRAGTTWQWDGVRFRFLHPSNAEAACAGASNRCSCVLAIAAPTGRVLLPGDIDRAVEATLIADDRAQLRAHLLIAPHHGSRSSSSAGFLDAVSARATVFSAGYRNRFGHPHPTVVERFMRLGTHGYQTSNSGAVGFRFRHDAVSPEVSQHRLMQTRIWSQSCSNSGATPC